MPWKIDQSWTVFLDRDGVINHRIMGGLNNKAINNAVNALTIDRNERY